MAIRGQHSAKAAMIAALDTRRTKQVDPGIGPLRARWIDRADQIGFDPARLDDLVGCVGPIPLPDWERKLIEDQMLGAAGLTAHESSFNRNDILRAWCDALPAGASIGVIEDLAEGLLDRLGVAALDGIVPGKGAVIRDVSGRTISRLPAVERWTTFELLEIERHALDTARRLLDTERGVCGQDELLAALRLSPSLSDEQVRAVIQITTSGNGVDIITAPAGAGKTFALATAREAWQRSGYRVIGAAHTGVAADELANAAGIVSTTIARMLIGIERGELGGLDASTILVVDEAGTAGTRDLARLLTEVDRSGAKAVLVGDPRQLPEIAAGGLFAALTLRQPAIELSDNRRQQYEWEIEALRQLRDGNTTHALHAYQQHGRITIGFDADHTKTLLLGDWWTAIVSGDDAIMLAGRRSEVAELNVHGHRRALSAGYLTGPTLEIDGVALLAGDKVMMLRNDRKLGVRNGNRGMIVDVDPDKHTIRVQLTRGIVNVPARYVDAGYVGHAYAMTVNKAHGLTCDHTMLLGNDLLYRELAYEALSRGRKQNRIYMSRSCMLELDLRLEDGPHARTVDQPDPIEVLAASLERRRNKHLALDSITAIPLDTWSTSDLLTERSRIQTVLDQAPPDRTGDLAALVESRHKLEIQVRETTHSVTALECRKRSRKQRRLPDVDLLTKRHNLGRFEQQADRIDTEITALHASQHRRRSHLAAHQADQIEIDAIGDILSERARQNTVRSVNEPPNYITNTIGSRPTSPTKNRAWVSAVVAIEQHRIEHNITDQRSAIGPEPNNYRDAHTWQQVNETIDDARDLIPPPRRAIQLQQPTVKGPSLDIGL